MAAMDSIASKFREYEYTIKLLTAKLEELAAENESLRSGLGAHGVLKLVYSDNNQPAGVRVKAAQAALNVEKPKLMPEKAAIDGTCEEVVPLAELLEKQRKRMDRMLAEAHDIEVSPSGSVRVLPKPGGSDGNGSDQ
jgi:hypothetical protein